MAHEESINVPPEMFHHIFERRIRAQLDWDRVLNAGWPIRLDVADTVAHVANWWTPWYLDGSGRATTYQSEGAQPIRVSDVPRIMERLGPTRRGNMDLLKRSIPEGTEPAHFTVATYSLGDAGRLILDGNHRVSAALATSKPFIALAFTIYGPIDAGVLPDLVHWSNPAV